MHQALRLTTTTKDGRRLEQWLRSQRYGNGPHDAADDSVKHSPGRRSPEQRQPASAIGEAENQTSEAGTAQA